MLPMLRLEQRLQQRYPDWFRGHRGRVAAPLLRGVARWSRFDAIDGFLDESGHLRGFEFVDAALRPLQLRYEADDGAARDRKSVGSGKGVSVRVDLGGRRFSKKKITKPTIN